MIIPVRAAAPEQRGTAICTRSCRENAESMKCGLVACQCPGLRAVKADIRAALQRQPVLILQARRRCVQERQLQTTQKRWTLFRSRQRRREEPREPGTGLSALRNRLLEPGLQRETRRLEPTKGRTSHRGRTKTATRKQTQKTTTTESQSPQIPMESITRRHPRPKQRPRAAVHRQPGQSGSARSMQARRPRPAQPSGPPMTCVGH